MTTLDEKLTSSLRAYAHINDDELGEDKFNGDFNEAKAIAAIYAAFKESGYISPENFDKMIEKNADLNKRWGVMTGQEWYDRFSKNIVDTGTTGFVGKGHIWYSDEEIDTAARRAAGVTHD